METTQTNKTRLVSCPLSEGVVAQRAEVLYKISKNEHSNDKNICSTELSEL